MVTDDTSALWRRILGGALLLSLAAVAAACSSTGQSAQNSAASRPAVGVEKPTGSAARLPFSISGWAIDRAASDGTGVDLVEVLDGGCQGTVIGIADYGIDRQDIAGEYGEEFRYSGFGFEVVRLSPGNHTLALRTTSTVTGEHNHCEALPLDISE